VTDRDTVLTGISEISQLVADHVVDVSDFPKPGILFKDLTPLFGDGPTLRACADAIAAAGELDGGFDLVAGIEARGFIVAAAVAYASGRGLVPVRKAGKLPGPTTAITYDLEYGTATLEIPQRSGVDGRRVLLVDDVLATGGTVVAAAELLASGGGRVVGVSVVLELAALTGRKRIAETHSNLPVHALLSV
jgi:adenine phosphoribosyltransferase